MPGNSLLIEGSCIGVLALLAVRAALRLSQDHRRSRGRRSTADGETFTAGGRPTADPGRRHRIGEAAHLAMALGMALMFLPLPSVRPLLVGLFGAIVLTAATAWLTDQARAIRARRRRTNCPCPPEHRLEPHHVIVGSAMIVVVLRSHSAASGMASMSGMAAGTGGLPDAVSLTILGYVWLSVLVLGSGLARAFQAEPALGGLDFMLGAPGTVYACELAMTVVMGLMLLA